MKLIRARQHGQMPRAARLLELMQILRRCRAPIRGEALSKELGISIRTLYRDIALLQKQGADIQGEPGVGYVLRPGFILPPLMFSIDELEALVLGASWVAARGDAQLQVAAEDVVAKIRAVLPMAMRAHVNGATLTAPVIEETAVVDISAIREAVRNERKVRFEYRNEAGVETRRTVWPLIIGCFDRVMLLAAWCELRADFRSFRVDRISTIEVLDAHFSRPRTILVEEWRQKRPALTAARH